MAFYNRLKESRINAGLTQEQLADKLGIAKSTLSGYESGNREPTVATIAKVLEILNIDANYLYQDEAKMLTEMVVSLSDQEHLKKYHSLDTHGKEMVDFTLEKEYERSQALAKQHQSREIPSYLEPVAAHQRTDIEITEDMIKHDDDIMDSDDF